MSNVLSRWETHIFFPQMVLGGGVYFLTAFLGFDTFSAATVALFFAGTVAVLFMVAALLGEKTAGVAIATSSLAAVLVMLCAIAGAKVFAGILGVICVAQAMLAALIITESGPSFLYRVLSSLPAIGTLLYLIERLSDRGREKAKG